MIDRTTGKRMQVEQGTVPRIRLPYEQLDDLRKLLDQHRVAYSVRESIISLGEGPFFAMVHLGRDADVSAVQSVLDGAP